MCAVRVRVLCVNGVGRGGMCSGRNAVGGKVDLGAKSRTSHKARLKSCDLTQQRLHAKTFGITRVQFKV